MSTSREVNVFRALVTKHAAKALPLAAIAQLRPCRLASRLLSALLVLLGLGTTLSLHGQTAVFMGAYLTLPTLTGSSPARGVAVDAEGNVWVTQYSSSGVFEIKAVNGVIPASPTIVTVASGNFQYPGGLTFDSAGDLFVADVGDNAVKEIVAVGGSIPASPTVKTIGSGFSVPWALSFDSAGDLWVADSGTNSIKEIVAVSGSIPASPTIKSVGSGFSEPAGVWVDANGNVFVSDTGHGAIKEMPGVAPTPPATPTINTLVSSFSYPSSLAVDGLGNVWVADYNANKFAEVVATNGSISSHPPIISYGAGSGVDGPIGVTIDALGNVYYTAGLGSIFELQQAPNFGQVQAGAGAAGSTLPTSKTLSLVFGFTSGGSILGGQVFTQGAAGQDFQDAGTGSCDTATSDSTFSNGSVCTVDVVFKPLYPGRRLGYAQIQDVFGDVLAGGTAVGVGVAPMINFGIVTSPGQYAPSSSTQFSFQAGTNVAVDTNHNIYVAAGNEILEATASSNYQTTTTIVAANGPQGLSLDGAGDLIWTDYGSGQILEVQAVNGVIPANPTPIALGSGWSVPWSSVIDGRGDVFVSDSARGGIYEIVAVNGVVSSSSTVRLVENTYPGLWTAFDSNGNFFFTSAYQHSCIEEIPAVDGQILSSTPIQEVYCSFGLPLTIAIDAAGNLWEADFYSGVSEVVAVNGVIPASPTVIDYNAYTFGLGLDENGNVFWTTYIGGNNNTLYEYDFSDPPTFTWSGSYNTGETSPTTYTAFATDAGNQPLSILIPSSETNPSINPNWTWATTATDACPNVQAGGSSAGTIGQNEICELTISFSPITGGPLTGQLTFTDNNLNAVPNESPREAAGDPTQSITLNGTAVGLSAPTINWGPLAAITYGNTLGSGDFNATAFSGGSNVSADGTFVYFVTSVGGSPAAASTILPGGSDTLCVQWTPSSEFNEEYNSASLCVPIQVNPASTSISWSPTSTTIIASSGPTASQLDASALAGETTVTTDGALTYYLSVVGGTKINVGATLPVGPATICVQWTPSSSYSEDYNSSSTCKGFTVINTQPTTTSVTSNANPVFSTYPVTFTATVTPSSGSIAPTGTVTFKDNGTPIGTGTLTASDSGASATAQLTTSGLAIGTHPITASYPGDTNNQSSSTTVALSQVIEDFSVVARPPTTSTIEPGSSATYSITVSPVSPATTFPEAITLTAAGLPTGATYTFAPSTIAAGAGSTNVTLTVTPSSSAQAHSLPPQSPAKPTRWPLMALAVLLLPLAGRLRRAGRRLSRTLSLMLLVAAAIVGAATLNGCGGVPSGYFGQAPSTSSITVTGTSGSLSHNASVSLTVE